MEKQEDRLRRMQRELGSMVIGPHGAGFPSMSWGAPPEAPRDTETVQVTWDEKPRQSGTASATWSNNTPEGLAAEITKPKPVFARTNKDGSPNYNVPNSGPATPVAKMAFDDRVMGGLEHNLGGDSIRNQLAYLDDVKSGNRTVDAPTSRHGLDRPAPQVAAAKEDEPPQFRIMPIGLKQDVAPAEPPAAAEDKGAGPLPPIPARPVGLQAPEVPKPAEAVAERPVMAPKNPKAAVNPIEPPAPSKITPAQRKLEARAKERSMQKNASMKPHLAQAAIDMGIEGVPFEELTGEQITDLRYNAGKMQRDAANSQINDRQSDRNAAREMANPPMMLATAQRLASRGRVLLAQAKGLADADPKKAALQSQGEQMIADGQEKHATFMSLWDRHSEQQIQQNVARIGMMFGKAGAGIVEQHLRGQADIQRQHLMNAGNVQQQLAANNGQIGAANVNAKAHVDAAGINADAHIKGAEINALADGKKIEAADATRKGDQDFKREMSEAEITANADRLKAEIDARAQAARLTAQQENARRPPVTPPEDRDPQINGPMRSVFSDRSDDTSIQEVLEGVRQRALQHEPDEKARVVIETQASALGARHALDRIDKGDFRPHDLTYIKSLIMTPGTNARLTREQFHDMMRSHYVGANWDGEGGVSAKILRLYDEATAKLPDPKTASTQVGLPDPPVV